MKSSGIEHVRGFRRVIRWRCDRLKWWTNFIAKDGLRYLEARAGAGRGVRALGPYPIDLDGDCEIHILTSRKDFLLALWALASFYKVGNRRNPLCVHDDGSLEPEHYQTLNFMFPGCTIFTSQQADGVIEEHLHGHPRLRQYRRMHPTARKLLDFVICARTSRFLLLDSDVLTFAPLDALDTLSERQENVFMRDYQYAFSLDKTRFERFTTA